MRGKDVNLGWVVVANKSRARIFRLGGSGGAEEIADLVNTDSRAHERDLVSDAPGRGQSFFGTHHGLGDGDRHKEEALKRFVRDIAETVEQGRVAGRFARLHLVAEPETLGLLRKALSTQAAALVDVTLNKDLVAMEAADVARQVAAR